MKKKKLICARPGERFLHGAHLSVMIVTDVRIKTCWGTQIMCVSEHGYSEIMDANEERWFYPRSLKKEITKLCALEREKEMSKERRII